MSETDSDEQGASRRPFIESDDEATIMDYDHGDLPVYVLVAWACFFLGFVTYLVTYLYPDLTAWGPP